MTEQELLDQIRIGVTQEMESALTADINPVLMHAVTQSYLLLKILDKLESMDKTLNLIAVYTGKE